LSIAPEILEALSLVDPGVVIFTLSILFDFIARVLTVIDTFVGAIADITIRGRITVGKVVFARVIRVFSVNPFSDRSRTLCSLSNRRSRGALLRREVE